MRGTGRWPRGVCVVERRAVWLEAARPRTLPAAVVPVAVGSAIAQVDGVFDWRAFALALAGSLAIQIAANFANDVSDARRGADPADRVGPKRMVASGVITPRQMWIATWVAIAVAAACGIGLALIAGPLVLVIGLASVVAMLGYVGGPLPYGYRGLGELFVFVFFGLVATVGSRYVHDGSVPALAWLLAVPIGFLATAILVINNLRDRDTDTRAGKRTLVVIIGTESGRRLFVLLIVGAFLIVAGIVVARIGTGWLILAWLSAPIAYRLATTVAKGVDPGELRPALGQTALLHLLFGLLVAVGIILGRLEVT
jgi:1,4-dihydroxy-2-naphthoate polyprenyltransferase